LTNILRIRVLNFKSRITRDILNNLNGSFFIENLLRSVGYDEFEPHYSLKTRRENMSLNYQSLKNARDNNKNQALIKIDGKYFMKIFYSYNRAT
jgi:hypothetical protein